MAYPVSVRGILESLSASRVISDRLEVSDVELGALPFAFTGPVEFEVTLTNTGAGIVASGSAIAAVRTSCVRCLCEFEMSVTSPVEGFYVFPGNDDEIPEEQEFEHISEDLKVDIEPAIVQSVVIDLPFAPVHSNLCKGICPTCGADRNVEECACGADDPASPFSGLAGLLDADVATDPKA